MADYVNLEAQQARAAQADQAELMQLVRDLAESLAAELEQRYPQRNQYRDEMRRYVRDMEPVERAARLLDRLEPRPSIAAARESFRREV